MWWFAEVARAESWCAAPLMAHEWGVTRLRGDGAAPKPGLGVEPWMAQVRMDSGARPSVRSLPADTGERDLPVISLFTSDSWSFPVPFALDVRFAEGSPTAWWPPADHLGGDGLGWDPLSLTREGSPSREATTGWVRALRSVPGALWVGHGDERERFVFYEGRTRESPALHLVRGDTWAPGRPHYVLENRTDAAVHDVVVVVDGRVWTAPTVPARRSAGFVLESPLDRAATSAWFAGRWSGAAPAEGWGPDCVMMRDPAVPVTTTTDHRMYAEEVQVVLSAWKDVLLTPEPGRAQIVYREDVATVDHKVPLAAYTDMYHYVELHRLSVVVVDGVVLP